MFVSPTQKAQVTVSIGVSSFGKSQPKVQNDLIAFADKALYLAKENGRNRTEILTFTVAQYLAPKGVFFVPEKIQY